MSPNSNLTGRGAARRLILAIALTGVTFVAAHAAAAAPALCRPVLTDASGDAREYYLPGQPNRPDLDIRSLAITTGSLSLKFQVQIEQLAAPVLQSDNYYVFFKIRESSYVASAYRGHDGVAFRLQSANESDPSGNAEEQEHVAGRFDDAGNTVTIEVPLALVQNPGRGTRLYDITAVTGATLGTAAAAAGSTIDDTSQGHVYTFGRGSCAR